MSQMRLSSVGLTLFTILLVAAACGDRNGGGAVEEEGGEPERGGTVVIAEGADMSLPMAIVAQSVFDANVAADIMSMELVRGAWEDGRLVYLTADRHPMALARRIEAFGPDSASLRFHMRSDVRWSDGEPLTAHDVVFTYELVRSPELASPLQNYWEQLDSVVAESDSTVVFNFRRRYTEMLPHSAMAIIPRHVFGDTPPAQIRSHPSLRNPENGNLVVSGSFMVGAWERGQRVVLVPNPHFEPRPYLAQIVFRIIPEPTTRLVELQTGNIDWVTGVTFDQLTNLRAQAPQVRFEREEKRFYDYIAYNPGGFEPFGDPEIRRALGLAIDADAIIGALEMDEYAVPAGGPYAPIFRDLYDPDLTPPLGYDPERATQILESKGWRDSDSDGIVDRDGRPFRFNLVTNAGNQRRADATQIIQQQWRQIGVDAQLRVLEFNTFQQGLTNRDYQAALGGWSVALYPDLTALWSPDSPFNITDYQNPEVQRLIEQAKAQPTPETANPLWLQAASQIVRDQPYTWLWYMDQVSAINNRVKNTQINTYGIYQNAWEWWIPEAQQRGSQGQRRDTTGQDTAR